MSSVWAARTALYIVRWGPPAGTSVFLCSRQAHHASVPSCNSTSHQYPSSRRSAATKENQKHQRSKSATDQSIELKIAESCKNFRRFITDPGLIDSVVKCLAPYGSSRTAPIIMDCNPGPGILTQALLDAGHKVFALENNSDFLPSLERIQKNRNGQLKVVHCDFFKIDPWSEGLVQPPSMYSSTLMKTLNISEVPWAADVPLKVFLMLGHKKERILLWRQIYSLYQRLSVYRFGRVELNVFMTENQYLKLISRPGDFMKYKALSVLFQVACDIELLHKEPTSSFLTPAKFRNPSMTKSGGFPDDGLCLVRITPRRNLFSENFTTADGSTFIHMIKQLLATRKSKLIDKLDNLAPGNGKDLLKSLALPMNIVTGCIYPEEYKLLFEILSHSEEFNPSFVLDEIYEDVAVPCY
ncbi:dimethyladenosine transferase 2, mitochondrial [Hyla sarda]|uniref:dimethyladenosine transferase 2, mitochondrial n=1 Tax=Hyla sarda TaxID=327740 RepID=UPI0024C336C0|nr:dimethyladenosine transferase 2, mitochondrial [Hyla sarda]